MGTNLYILSIIDCSLSNCLIVSYEFNSTCYTRITVKWVQLALQGIHYNSPGCITHESATSHNDSATLTLDPSHTAELQRVRNASLWPAALPSPRSPRRLSHKKWSTSLAGDAQIKELSLKGVCLSSSFHVCFSVQPQWDHCLIRALLAAQTDWISALFCSSWRQMKVNISGQNMTLLHRLRNGC